MPNARHFPTSLLLAAALLAGCEQNTPFPKPGPIKAAITGQHHFDHIVLVVLENENAVTARSVPYLDSLAKSGAYLTEYYAVAHPSYPNYLALAGGQTFIGSDRAVEDPDAHSAKDFGDAQLLIDAPSLGGRLERAKLTWDVFAEDYPVKDSVPSRCDFRRSAGHYVRKHVPFLSFKEFRDDPGLCAHVRNLKWLRPDSLAAYTFIVPNMVHDGHDAPLRTAVAWLRDFLKPIIANPEVMKSTLVVVTFDESATSGREKLFGARRPNLIYAAFVGGMVKTGAVSNVPYTHYSLLKMVEENFGLAPSLAPEGTEAVDGIWK